MIRDRRRDIETKPGRPLRSLMRVWPRRVGGGVGANIGANGGCEDLPLRERPVADWRSSALNFRKPLRRSLACPDRRGSLRSCPRREAVAPNSRRISTGTPAAARLPMFSMRVRASRAGGLREPPLQIALHQIAGENAVAGMVGESAVEPQPRLQDAAGRIDQHVELHKGPERRAVGTEAMPCPPGSGRHRIAERIEMEPGEEMPLALGGERSRGRRRAGPAVTAQPRRDRSNQRAKHRRIPKPGLTGALGIEPTTSSV